MSEIASVGSSEPPRNSENQPLVRRLGTVDAVTIGLGAMLGAGVFVAFAPAARAAGSWLLVGLLVAAVVAYCNARSSARLAARYPESGGTYVYGRERLGEIWGYLAGWGFVVGKTASCAAMALTVAAYLLPSSDRIFQVVVAVAAVVSLTAMNYRGVRKAAWLTRLIVTITVLVLVAAFVAVFVTVAGGGGSPGAVVPTIETGGGAGLGGTVAGIPVAGILGAAGLLFFAFAGYARIATLGEEVREPARTIPRAIGIALGITLVVYVGVGVAVLAALGPAGVAAAVDPVAAAVNASGWRWLAPVIRVGAAIAALGALLALVLGISRTALAMARDGHLPRQLAAVHPRFGVPHRAEVAVGVAVVLLVCLVDLRQAIGFSSFAVLTYYAIANASALTLPGSVWGRWVLPTIGLVGCVAVAISLPPTSTISGVVVLLIGLAIYVIRRLFGARR